MKKKLSIKLLLLSVLISIPLYVYGALNGTLTVDGNTDIDWREGERGAISFSGDFGSGTITVLYLVGSTYVNFKDSSNANISYTDDNGFEFICPSGGADVIRITLSGSTSPDIDYIVTRERN